jgi:hypothetical protein
MPRNLGLGERGVNSAPNLSFITFPSARNTVEEYRQKGDQTDQKSSHLVENTIHGRQGSATLPLSLLSQDASFSRSGSISMDRMPLSMNSNTMYIYASAKNPHGLLLKEYYRDTMKIRISISEILVSKGHKGDMLEVDTSRSPDSTPPSQSSHGSVGRLSF